MATHSSDLAWRIPGTGEPGGLPSMGSQRRTRLKRLRSSSSSSIYWELPQTYKTKAMVIDKLINSFIDNCQTTDRVY